MPNIIFGALLILSVVFYIFYNCHDLRAGFECLKETSGHFHYFVPVDTVEANENSLTKKIAISNMVSVGTVAIIDSYSPLPLSLGLPTE